jgi:hypothetical protein
MLPSTKVKQIQCPHCSSYKVISVSPKKILLIGGFISLAIGGLLAIFMIGIPFIILGPVLMVMSLIAKEDGKKTCKSCGYTFISDAK